MAPYHVKKWLLFVHQLPPKPNALRVRIWRRLNQIGAVAVKQSVYVMPYSEEAREDLSWVLKEIVNGGGNGFISEVSLLEGLSDEEIIELFQNARKADYESLIQEANHLLGEWSSGQINPRDPELKGQAHVARLQRRFEKIAAIDFFQAPERWRAEIAIKDLAARLSGHGPDTSNASSELTNLKGKTWVTRKNIFVDRIACGWLIRRFVDNEAVFKFVQSERYAPAADEVRFDMFDGEYTHEGDRCTFEVMIRRFHLCDHALGSMAKVVHDIDLKDDKYSLPETDGFNALLAGLVASQQHDDLRMTEGFKLFEMLHAYFQRHR